MGRPLEFDRDAAVTHAMNEIWQNGYEASSVSAMADAMGITRSSFYNAFSSREELFREVLSRYMAGAPDAAFGDIGPGDPVVPAIRAVFRAVCRARAADRRGCLAVNCLGELAGTHAELGPLMSAALDQRLEQLYRLLRQAAAQGELAQDAALRDKALALQALLVGINTLSRTIASDRRLWRMASVTLDGLGLGG